LTGVADYEVAKALMEQAKSKLNPSKGLLSGYRLERLLSKLPTAAMQSNASSPILRHIGGAIREKTNPSPMVRFLQKKWSGPDAQVSPFGASALGGVARGLISTVPNSLGAGIVPAMGQVATGALGGALSALPEASLSHAIAKGALNTFLKLKGVIADRGYKMGLNESSPIKRLAHNAIAEAAYLVNPSGAELGMLGRDIGRAVDFSGKYIKNLPSIASNVINKNLGLRIRPEQAAMFLGNETPIPRALNYGLGVVRKSIESNLGRVTATPWSTAIKQDTIKSRPMSSLKSIWSRVFGKKAGFEDHHMFLIRQAFHGN
jgi:hypothetical protein